MIKPILKIELSSKASKEDADKIIESFKEADISKDYYILVMPGNSDFTHVEIITASDVSIHKP